HGLLLFVGLLTFGLSWLLLGPVTYLTVALAYGTLFIGGGEGATPGMRLFGIEARGLNGGRPDYFQAFLMTALFYATVPVTSFLILIVAFFTEHNRTAHDFLSGITVIRRNR
ncbi:MAG: RDD family protein, partial [Dongiaceae bacterium]